MQQSGCLPQNSHNKIQSRNLPCHLVYYYECLSPRQTVPPMIFLFFQSISEAFILSFLFSVVDSKIILGFSLYISRCSATLGSNNVLHPSKVQITTSIYLTKDQQYSERTAVRIQTCTKTKKENKNIIHACTIIF